MGETCEVRRDAGVEVVGGWVCWCWASVPLVLAVVLTGGEARGEAGTELRSGAMFAGE